MTIGCAVGADGAALGNADLEIGEEFEQKRLELMVRTVDLIDQQHPLLGCLEHLQQRPRDQETVVIDVDLVLAGMADGEQLALVVPFVERMRGIDALVALQPHQIAAEQFGDRLGGLRLADAGRAFEQQRLAQPDRQEDGGGQAFIGEIARGGEALRHRLRRCRDSLGACPWAFPSLSSPLAPSARARCAPA